MDPFKLHEDQLIFELSLRKKSTDGDLNVLAARLQLEILLASECHHVEVDTAKEVEYCKSGLEQLSREVAGIGSRTRTPKVKAIQSKIIHMIHRANNIKANDARLVDIADSLVSDARELTQRIELMVSGPVDSDSDRSDAEDKLSVPVERRKKTPTKSADNATVPVAPPMPLHFPGLLHGGHLQYYYPGEGIVSGANLPQPDPSHGPSLPIPAPSPPEIHSAGGSKANVPPQQPVIFSYQEPKAEPLYKWKIKKFDGTDPACLYDFLAEVEEKARTRFMSHDRLFMESAELFEGEALVWHRHVVRTVTSWAQLKEELLVAYHGYGLDSHLREQIRATKQTESQSIDVFLAKIGEMYERLERKVDEKERLGEILRNLNPFLKDRLMMIPIHSISELQAAARMAESGRTRMGGVPALALISSEVPG